MSKTPKYPNSIKHSDRPAPSFANTGFTAEVLSVFQDEQVHSKPELEKLFRVSPETMTYALQRLVKKGEIVSAGYRGQGLYRLKTWKDKVIEHYASTYEDSTPVEAPKPEPVIEVVPEKITQVEEHRLKRRVAELQAQINDLIETASMNDEMSELIREVRAMPPVKGIEPRERKSGLAEATPLVLASDWHIEEEVRPEQVAGRNRYNLEISKQRMERFFEATRWAIGHQREIFQIKDLVMWLGGDIITGHIHMDNIQSNLLSPVEAIAYAQASVSDGIRFLLEDNELDRLLIPCNDGNHGRLTEKMRAATRIENSIEWLLYYQLQREFKNDPRVEFILPTSPFTFFNVYDRTIRATHGDLIKYNSGVGGITIPLMKALARWETVRHADLTILGHFHQRINLPDLMANSSLIGYNTYAMAIGARLEAPSQSLRMLEPRRFCSTDVALWVSNLEDDVLNQETEAA